MYTLTQCKTAAVNTDLPVLQNINYYGIQDTTSFTLTFTTPSHTTFFPRTLTALTACPYSPPLPSLLFYLGLLFMSFGGVFCLLWIFFLKPHSTC